MRRFCRQEGCEVVRGEVRELATHRVTITGPTAPAKANKPFVACGNCAAVACEAFIGYGWGVKAELLEATPAE